MMYHKQHSVVNLLNDCSTGYNFWFTGFKVTECIVYKLFNLLSICLKPVT